MKNNLEYKGMLRLCLLFICFLVPPPYFAHFPHGHRFKSFSNLDTQQQYQLSGTVTDSYGPMPGVHVLIKGTNTGTFTDPNGNYSLMVNNKDILVFSYLGYHTRELSVLGRTKLDVQLLSEVTELQEVEVNAGYYTVKEKERTGSISRVTAAEIERQPIVSPMEALQGRMAGVEVVQTSGVPGSAPTIRIRGQNSLRNGALDNGNLPLYIIDGVPVNSSAISGLNSLNNLGIDPLSTINLSNIESIEVLKDADATAIYGSRGANGVVLITTKKGNVLHQGTEIEARLYSGLGKVSRTMDLLNTEQYLKLRNQAFENDGAEPTEANAEDLTVWDPNRYTDWQEELFGGTAIITDMGLAVTGGNETTSFRLGGGYHKEETVFPGDFGYHKLTAGLNLNHTSKNKKLGVDFTINYGKDQNDLFNGDDFVRNGLYLPPNAPAIFTEDGELNWENNTWDNPYAVLYNSSTAEVDNLVANVGLSYQLFKGLNIKTNAGYTALNSVQTTKIPKKSSSPDIRDGQIHRSRYSHTQRSSWIVEPQLEYGLKLGDSRLNALVGATFQQSENNRLYIIGGGYASESLIGNLNAAEEVSVLANTETDYKYHALFARIGFNLAHKYLVNLTARRDGSSRFGPNKRFSNFWAVGGAWVFSKERTIQDNIPFLSFGKLRGSYGITGNDQIPDYGYLDAYAPTPGPGGLYPIQLTNPDYSWEENKKLEAALELGFIEDRINVGLGWYRNRSSNQLVGYPLPATTGFATVQANLPATVQNTGWEIELSTLNFRNRDFRWQTSLNLSFPKNKLVSYPNIGESSYVNTYRVGYPLNISLLYQYEGVDAGTGLYKITDVNGDGKFDYEDRTVIQDRGRVLFGGLNNSIGYKNLSLQFLWEFVVQEAISPYFPSPMASMSNQPLGIYKAWENGRIGSEIQQISQSTEASRAYSNALNTVHFVSDASFLRLKTMSLGYNLPTEVLNKMGVESCKLFLNAHNLFTITDYIGLDPQYTGGTVIPVLKTISCGLQINL